MPLEAEGMIRVWFRQSGETAVGDIENLFTEWDQWGRHRVTFYDDLKAPVFALADTMGRKVLEEA